MLPFSAYLFDILLRHVRCLCHVVERHGPGSLKAGVGSSPGVAVRMRRVTGGLQRALSHDAPDNYAVVGPAHFGAVGLTRGAKGRNVLAPAGPVLGPSSTTGWTLLYSKGNLGFGSLSLFFRDIISGCQVLEGGGPIVSVREEGCSAYVRETWKDGWRNEKGENSTE